MRLESAQAAALVVRAAAGDEDAWDALVEHYNGLVWTVIRSHRLQPRDADDAAQTTWLRLLEHIDRLEQPSRVAAWLVTTTRRECLRIRELARRVVLVEEESDLEPAEHPSLEDEVHATLHRQEQRRIVRLALDQLSDKERELMLLLFSESAPSYADISRHLGIPIGSIGPTRMRCVNKMRLLVDATS